MLLRWLLPVVTVLAMLASSVTAFAAAGIIGESACCCPDPDTCKCHDHDGDAQPSPELKRCGGEAQRVMAQITPAISVTPELPPVIQRLLAPTVYPALPMPPSLVDRPEKPPF